MPIHFFLVESYVIPLTVSELACTFCELKSAAETAERGLAESVYHPALRRCTSEKRGVMRTGQFD